MMENMTDELKLTQDGEYEFNEEELLYLQKVGETLGKIDRLNEYIQSVTVTKTIDGPLKIEGTEK